MSYQQFVGDPSVSKVGNVLRMYVKGFNANGGQKLVGHKTQYAESSDGGNTFQMQQQLVLDSASVPEGVEMQAKLTLNRMSTNDTACIGEDARFEVSVGIEPSSLGLRYEWQKNGIKISNGGRITGATTSTLNITKTELSDSGSYSVNIFVDDLSTGSLQQNVGPIRLILNPATTLLKEPDSLYVICHDEEVTLSCDAMGSNVTYQWYDMDAKPLPGQNKKELIVRKTTSDKHSYYCMMKGDCGLITSRIARVKFIPKLVIEKDLSQIYELEVGNDTTLSVLTNCTECTNQWYKDGKPIKPEEQVVNGKASIIINDMDSTQAGIYHVMFRNGCETIESQKTNVKMRILSSIESDDMPTIYPQPSESIMMILIPSMRDTRCELFDLHGQRIALFEIKQGKGYLSTIGIPSGMYILNIDSKVMPCTILH
ncbi:MAG: T9SS type A sorting domain-containing protein [Candidatus Kapaibacteriota bacterium]